MNDVDVYYYLFVIEKMNLIEILFVMKINIMNEVKLIKNLYEDAYSVYYYYHSIILLIQ